MDLCSPKKISIIMPCFNAEAHIEDSVKSVLNQTYKNFELIIIDDGSTDSSLSLATEIKTTDNRIKVINQKNKGPGPARNRGLNEAKGDYIAFLDSDDYWSPDCLQKLEKALSSNFSSPYGLVYCGWQNMGLTIGKSQPYIPPDYSSVDLSELFLGGCRWPIHAALLHRECIERVDGFNEQWTSCMDYDLWLRMTPFLKVVLVPEVLAFYRHHNSGQITKNRALVAENHWKVQKDFLSQRPETVRRIGKEKINNLVYGELLRRGFLSYWERDLDASHKIFRLVMKGRYGSLKDWKYMLPALLPMGLYKRIFKLFSID
ncbi:glycosyltransferase family 2 protein [Desulfospira joergensenii]|uniref:glycosyltransferase family 2 protein n=1 Tax=Desulfospira joergensenii TaxID=53329 RepID=UPI0003B3F379|nr:glycosyltransferase [Desulfospira joergensenii]